MCLLVDQVKGPSKISKLVKSINITLDLNEQLVNSDKFLPTLTH